MKHSDLLSLPPRAKVVLCERDPKAVAELRNDLDRLGHEVTVVREEAEAIARLSEEGLDLLILDADEFGLEPLRLLAATPGREKVIRIVRCASTDERVAFEAYRMGANWVLPRRCRLVELWPFTSVIDTPLGSW